MDATGGFYLAERLRHLVEVNPYPSGQLFIPLTVSIGLKTRNKDTRSLKSLLAQADQALYKAKTAGRNRVIMADAPTRA